MVKARFAPSPTGYLHIGGARTCLFSWLFARHNNGKFILRIEDTDLERSKKEYLDEIIESIKWLGMDFDEIYYQSQRFDLYRDYAKKLVSEGKALEKDNAVFFKYDFTSVEIDDLIRGKIVFNELPKEEEVIIKSDGSPTYNFSCVIDDALMGMTHVVRGEDHISNTPKQILMYKALGFNLPAFVHVPLILSPDGGRLSKRHGATSIREYRDMGFLSESIANYLMLLSWSPGHNREIISLAEAKEIFDLKNVNKTGAAFSLDKLTWVNASYIRSKSLEDFASLMGNYLQQKNILPPGTSQDYLIKVAALFKERISTLAELCDWVVFCFRDDFTYSEDTKEILENNLADKIDFLIQRLNGLQDFSKTAIEEEFRKVCEELGVKAKVLVHPVRVALSGKRIGPGLFEAMEVLGKDKVSQRLERLINYWRSNEKK